MKYTWNYCGSNNRSIFEQIRHNRNITDSFIYTSLADIPDVSLMKDLDKASNRIIDAIHKKEKIIIYGHDDIDGITSTYILFDFLEKMGSQNHYYYIPNRMIESHGIHKKFIEKAKCEKYDLLITVDGGISSYKAVADIQKSGCDVIITDHHLIQEETIPDAYAVINPKQKDCNYPFDMLAGVGITYFLICKLAEKLNSKLNRDYLFWVAVGTIADKVPLNGVNRVLVKEVLDNWFTFNDKNLEKLKPYLWPALSHYNRMGSLKYIIKLLSSGRQSDGKNLTMKFLLTRENEKELIIQKLIARQKEQEVKLKELHKHLKKIMPEKVENCFIYYDFGNDISFDFLGYCAAQVTKVHKIPAVFLKDKKGIVIGEARCAEGSNLVDAFAFCKEHLIQFGGHAQAAGFTAKKDDIHGFEQKFEEYIEQNKDTINDNRKINIDAVFTIDEFDKFDEYLQLDYHALQPFGKGNPNPHFLLKNYLPERDSQRIRVKSSEYYLEPDEYYHLVFKLKGTSFKLVDHRKANYLL
ncbi:MAG: DHH family phosphoesterase [Candidatus Cloacimonetes bacterium]|nr:DHH family phosphoesterase [Candidatus Cloacimonadota bacterium]